MARNQVHHDAHVSTVEQVGLQDDSRPRLGEVSGCRTNAVDALYLHPDQARSRSAPRGELAALNEAEPLQDSSLRHLLMLFVEETAVGRRAFLRRRVQGQLGQILEE